MASRYEPICSLRQLYVENLEELYSAEVQTCGLMGRIINSAGSPELRLSFSRFLTQHQQQIARIDVIFLELGVPRRERHSHGAQGLLMDAEALIGLVSVPAVRDAALIAAMQRIDHFLISSFGTASMFARLLGLDTQAAALGQTVSEEAQTDCSLTELACRSVNCEAAATLQPNTRP